MRKAVNMAYNVSVVVTPFYEVRQNEKTCRNQAISVIIVHAGVVL